MDQLDDVSNSTKGGGGGCGKYNNSTLEKVKIAKVQLENYYTMFASQFLAREDRHRQLERVLSENYFAECDVSFPLC